MDVEVTNGKEGLVSKNYKVLQLIINDTKCFDRRDNTFLLSNRKLATRLSISPSKVDQLFREMRNKGLVKKVRSVDQGIIKSIVKVVPLYNMLDPKFLFISYTKSDIFISCALWDLECIGLVREWRGLCKRFNCYIDPIHGDMSEFNWYYIERIANGYQWFDRCYRKGSRTPSRSSKPESIYRKEDADYEE